MGIKIDRDINDKLIKDRVKHMLNEGWIEEVENLLDSGINPKSAAMMSIGYRDILEFINGESDREEMEEKIYISTRKLMRHQDNWFKKSDKYLKSKLSYLLL